MLLNKAYINRIETSKNKILEFMHNPTGYLKEGMVLVNPEGVVFGITSKHGNYTNPEMTYAKNLLNHLSSLGIRTIEVDEQIRPDLKYKKFSALNRQNSTGWEQVKTYLVAIEPNAPDPNQIRDLFIEWKNTMAKPNSPT